MISPGSAAVSVSAAAAALRSMMDGYLRFSPKGRVPRVEERRKNAST